MSAYFPPFPVTLLDDEARDALAEAVNLALGEAAADFSDMAQKEIKIHVTALELLPRDTLLRQLQAPTTPPGDGPPRFCRVAQHFQSPTPPVRTEVVLLFPEPTSLEWVRRMLGDGSPSGGPLSELEHDALAELGNLLINRSMHSLSKLLGNTSVGALPELRTVKAEDVVGDRGKGHERVLKAHMVMSLCTRRFSGDLLFLMDEPALEATIHQIHHLVGLDLPETL